MGSRRPFSRWRFGDDFPRLRFALVWLTCVYFFASSASAGSGEFFSLPRGGANPSGLIVGVDPQWVDASGYRSVRIHLSTANRAPTARDRTLRVELSPNHDGRGERLFVTTAHVTLPQGQQSAKAHVLVPQNQPWEELFIDCYEGGRRRKELCGGKHFSSFGDWSEAIPAILLVHGQAPSTQARGELLAKYQRNPSTIPSARNLPDVRGLSTLVSPLGYIVGSQDGSLHDMETLGRVVNHPRLELLPPDDLPETWLGLTCFDLILVPLGDMRRMSQQQPARFRALTDWAAAGGNLLVYGVGGQYEQMAELERLCRLSPATAGKEFAAAGWTLSESWHFNENAARAYHELHRRHRWDHEEGNGEPDGDRPPIEDAFGRLGDYQMKFLTRPCGMGLVIAMGSSDPFPGSTTEWSWVLNTVDDRRTMWYRRHGLSLRRQNSDFWDFLIPGTGKAPVAAFCVLITLFAVLIGPVNYYFLARRRRLYLLLATIPAGAALVTLGLFAYALATDGLGTQVRIRSYTCIDQQAGRTASWSRQSYYAGVAPSRGLAFPADAAVYTLEQFPSQEYEYGWQPMRAMIWDGGQHLRSGYMSSRVTSQFLVIRSGETSAGLFPDKLAAPGEAANRLGGKIEMLLVRDQAGDFFWAEDVAAGDKAKLAAADFLERKQQLYERILDNRPAVPEGFSAADFQHRYGHYGWYGYGLLDHRLSEPRTATSLMETQIRRLQNAQADDIAPGSYVAIVETSPEAPLGVAGARQHKTIFHVIEGKF